MTRDDIRKLMGGYATGSLTDAERKSLFEAALDDQELFDELSREQALKEVLDEPGAKQRLIAVLATPEKRRFAWWPLAAIAGAVVALLVVFINVDFKRPAQPVEMARVEPQPAPRIEPAPIAPKVRDTASRDERDKSSVRAFENRPSPGSPSKPAQNAKRVVPSAAAPSPAPAQAPAAARSKDMERQDVKQEANQISQQQVQVQAAAPFADSGQRSQTAGTVGGVAVSGRFAAKKASPTLSLNYSVEDGELILKFAATGYFSVHFSPGLDTIVDSHVAAGSTRREHIPNNATEADIVFSALPQSTSGGVSLTSDSKTGTASDPAGTRIELLVRFYP